MRWCCFLFWSGYRFTLTLLAHFNWFASIYVDCIYFVLWKSYDLLFFWLHLILCMCFKPLRNKNYLIVWCNLIRNRMTVYPNNTYEEVYMYEYGKPRKLRKQRPDVINEAEAFDREQEQDSDSDGRSIGTIETQRAKREELSSRDLKFIDAVLPDEEICECMKQIGSSPIQSNASMLQRSDHDDAPVPPLYLGKQVQKPRDDHNQKTGSHTPIRWNQFDIRDTILKFLKCSKQCVYCVPCGKRHSLGVAVEMTSDETGNASDSRIQLTLTSRILRWLPLQTRSDSSVVKAEIDVLTPDFTNKRDLTGGKEILSRQKRDRKKLKKRLQARKRAELALVAKYESK